MKVLAIQGSPRTKGNTQAVLEIVLAAAEEAGAEVEVVQLAELKDLTGCQECFNCQKAENEPGCAVADDLTAVVDKALAAEVVVWATPVFCWSPSWLAKMAMDRFYCMFKFNKDGSVRSLLRGRKMAVVITAGGGENDGADLVQETYRRMAKFGQAEWLGAFVASEVATPAKIRADGALVERAKTFGRRLVS